MADGKGFELRVRVMQTKIQPARERTEMEPKVALHNWSVTP